MKDKILTYLFILSVLALVHSGCKEAKPDLTEFSNSGGQFNVSDTIYIQQSPVWTQFNEPNDVYIGREPLVYVADTKNNRVVQLDLSGAEISSKYFNWTNVSSPRKVAQDYLFDLLVICDSVVNLDTISVIYRLKLVENQGLVGNAPAERLISSLEGTVLSNSKRKFTGISVFPDNSFIVTRTGPNNSGIDPDNAILIMKGRNSITSVQNLSGFQTTGGGVYSIYQTSAVKTINNNATDFVITRSTSEFGFKVLWFEYDNINGIYVPKFLPESNVDLLKKQFSGPASLALDNNNNLFIVDAVSDSLYRYSSGGKILPGSFGGNGAGEKKLNNPKGVSYFNKVLYIADTKNNRIVRYKLSTDIN